MPHAWVIPSVHAEMNSHKPIEPFWNRLGSIALYPLRGAALISLLLYSLLSLLKWLPGIGWFLSLVVWFAIYRYAFEILLRTANGHLQAPELASYSDSGMVWRFFGLWLLFVATFIAGLLLAGPLAGVTALLALTLLLPGAIIALAMGDNLGHAINPATSLGMIRRIGAPYFVAFGLLFVIQLGAAFAGELLARFMPAGLAELLLTAATLWGLFATFHLMGYLVYQYHNVLGFIPGVRKLPRLRTRDTDLMDEVEALVSGDEIQAAIARLQDEMRERAVPMETHVRYRQLLRERNDTTGLLEHAGLYLNLLLLDKRDMDALALTREALDADPDFTPLQAEDGHHLALRALGMGRSKLACELWVAMLKRWPRDPARVDWAVAVAPLLAQRNRPGLAHMLLERCARRLDDPEQLARIEASRATLPPV